MKKTVKCLSYLIYISLFLVACQQKKTDKKASVAAQEKFYKKMVDSWKTTSHETSPIVKSQVENWNEYYILQQELSRKPQPTLGAIIQKTASLSKKTKQVLETIPESIKTKELISRLKVLQSKIEMLQVHVRQDYLNVENINKYNNEVVADFEAIETQLVRDYQKKQIQLEEGEAELQQSIH